MSPSEQTATSSARGGTKNRSRKFYFWYPLAGVGFMGLVDLIMSKKAWVRLVVAGTKSTAFGYVHPQKKPRSLSRTGL